MDQVQVGIVMGSDSYWPLVKKACETLEKFGVGYETRVISAHRTPDVALEYSKTAEERGLRVIIAAAGGAAHLGGVLAAGTVLPVVGIPVAGGALNGLDAANPQAPSCIFHKLLSFVQYVPQDMVSDLLQHLQQYYLFDN